jgi:uncharacterized RDD family membrane protein YckC
MGTANNDSTAGDCTLANELLAIAEGRALVQRSGHMRLQADEHVLFELPTELLEPRDLSEESVAVSREWSSGGLLPFGFRTSRTKTVRLPTTDEPTVIDVGVFTITDQRLIFRGPKRAREWPTNEVISFGHDAVSPTVYLQIRGRDVATGIAYDGCFENHLWVALITAAGGDDAAALVATLRSQCEAAGAVDDGPVVIGQFSTLDRHGNGRHEREPALPLRAAPPLTRMAARAIDGFLLIIVFALVLSLFQAAMGLPSTSGVPFGPPVVVMIGLIALYQMAADVLIGASPGKWVFRLAVVDVGTGERVSPLRLVARSAVQSVAWATIIGFARDCSRVWHGREPVHDRVTGTGVFCMTRRGL